MDFDYTFKKLNKNVTSNKTKHVLVENELNELLKEVKAISTKRLTKDLVNQFIILNGAKNLSSGIFQNYLVFNRLKNIFNVLVALLGLFRGNLMEYQKKLLKS